MSYTWLPPLLSEIADVVGIDATIALADARGGSRISIPAKIKSDHWLNEVVGPEAAQNLCEYYRTGEDGKTGAVLDLPVGPASSILKLQMQNNKRIDEMLADGVSVDHIARTVHVHRTTIFRRKALQKDGSKDTSQPSLLDLL